MALLPLVTLLMLSYVESTRILARSGMPFEEKIAFMGDTNENGIEGTEFGGYRGYWVGGTNILENSTFIWNQLGHPIDPKMWDKGEPSYTNHAEYCTELRAWNGKLNDDECHNWRGYLCGKCIH